MNRIRVPLILQTINIPHKLFDEMKKLSPTIIFGHIKAMQFKWYNSFEDFGNVEIFKEKQKYKNF